MPATRGLRSAVGSVGPATGRSFRSPANRRSCVTRGCGASDTRVGPARWASTDQTGRSQLRVTPTAFDGACANAPPTGPCRRPRSEATRAWGIRQSRLSNPAGRVRDRRVDVARHPSGNRGQLTGRRVRDFRRDRTRSASISRRPSVAVAERYERSSAPEVGRCQAVTGDVARPVEEGGRGCDHPFGCASAAALFGLEGDGCQLRPVRRAELPHGARHVRFDGASRDEEASGDLGIAAASADEFGDFDLAWAEEWPPLMPARVGPRIRRRVRFEGSMRGASTGMTAPIRSNCG